MKYFDQHVHSYYSFDSNQRLEDYLIKAKELGISYFVTTNHIDLNYLDEHKDLDFDIEKEHRELAKLQGLYPEVTILKGIEIGYKSNELRRINKIVNSYDFDLINFSVHENGLADYYYQDEFIRQGIDTVLNGYYDLIYESMLEFKNYDVLCHIDFGFKTAYLMDDSLKISKYEEKLIKIFQLLIKENKTFEINTKVQEFLNDAHTKYLLLLYKRLGGTDITLSSDAHTIDRFMSSFDHYKKLIKECGFEKLCYFVKREKKYINIE